MMPNEFPDSLVLVASVLKQKLKMVMMAVENLMFVKDGGQNLLVWISICSLMYPKEVDF
jgi:hypothetical protein